MKKDIISKEAIKTLAIDIAFYILKLNVKKLKFVDKELKRIEKREADIVAQCEIDGIEQMLHIEIQNSNDKLMPRRMLRYYTDIKTQFQNLEVKQYVIYIGKPKLSMDDYIKENNLEFKYNIIDMHTIDCEEFIRLDTPDALVLSILCDFKGKDELEMLKYIITRLAQLSKNDEHKLGKYMLMLETLSDNRDLKTKLKEAEDMLREIKYENLPSYEIGMERGIAQGISQGITQGIIESATLMIKEFNLSVDIVAKKLNISADKLREYLDKE